ncbi:MAG: hypothetical protein HONBIEJF_02681 [Fimbriimonadaceae bacterium]|nr:hypothetical protein [Fimbriimonadaceae bacterium]
MALVRIEQSFRTQLEWQDIEDRLYAIAEWLGYELIYEDPDYVFMRGDNRTFMPSLLAMPTTLTVSIGRGDGLESDVSLNLLIAPGAGSSVSQGEAELLRQELNEVIGWIERLESPTIDRTEQVAWGHRRDVRLSVTAEVSIWVLSIVAAWLYGWQMGVLVLVVVYSLAWYWDGRMRRKYPEFPLTRPGPHMGLSAKLRERYHLARATELRELQGRPVFDDAEF